ncbi:hypothetical protein ATR1_256c0001, partial [Acetobacter tropicalis]
IQSGLKRRYKQAAMAVKPGEVGGKESSL